jgi:large subunit ribosomal protein L25
MNVGDAIRVGDLPLPSGVTTDVDPEDPVVTAAIVQQDVPEPEVAEGEEGEAAEGGEGATAEDAGEGEDRSEG